MKKCLIFLVFCSFTAFSQKKLPNVALQNLSGESVESESLIAEKRPVLISFWATWCKPCMQEINAIHKNLDIWQKETNVRFVAISVDDSRSKARVPTLVNARKWNFEVLIDENGDLQKAMNVLNVPHSFIIDSQGNIVYQHNAYSLGDEAEYLEKLRKVAGK